MIHSTIHLMAYQEPHFIQFQISNYTLNVIAMRTENHKILDVEYSY